MEAKKKKKNQKKTEKKKSINFKTKKKKQIGRQLQNIFLLIYTFIEISIFIKK